MLFSLIILLCFALLVRPEELFEKLRRRFNSRGNRCLSLSVGVAHCLYHGIERATPLFHPTRVALIPLYIGVDEVARRLTCSAGVFGCLCISRFGLKLSLPPGVLDLGRVRQVFGSG